jgi:hypothetical protein
MGHQKVKMQQWKEGEKRISQIILSSRKSVHFFGDKVLRKMYGKEQCRKEKQKRVNCKN